MMPADFGEMVLVAVKEEPTIVDDESLHDPLAIPEPYYTGRPIYSIANAGGKKRSCVCDTCGYRAPYPSRLTNHARTHTGEKPYGCDVCNFRTTQPSYLRKHKKYHNDKRPYYICDHCGYESFELQSMKRHIIIHTGEKPCDFCDYRASQLHNNLLSRRKTHTVEKPYACTTCGFRYTTTSKSHMKIPVDVYPCNFCDFRTEKIKALQKHTKTLHGEKPYSCDICSFKGSCRSAVKVHMRSHTGDSPYSCYYCNHRARQISDLKRHLRTHTGEKPFPCDLCDYRASQMYNLRNHMKIHVRKCSLTSLAGV